MPEIYEEGGTDTEQRGDDRGVEQPVGEKLAAYRRRHQVTHPAVPRGIGHRAKHAAPGEEYQQQADGEGAGLSQKGYECDGYPDELCRQPAQHRDCFTKTEPLPKSHRGYLYYLGDEGNGGNDADDEAAGAKGQGERCQQAAGGNAAETDRGRSFKGEPHQTLANLPGLERR